eukprot:m51a1_g11865 hypothetical protein (554) ;mRNA; r:520819-523013
METQEESIQNTIVTEYSFEWKDIQAASPPGKRIWHSSASVGGRYVVVTGGYSGSSQRYYNDAHVLDVHARRWVANVENAIDRRYAHSSTQIGDTVYVFGGGGGAVSIYLKTLLALPTDPGNYAQGVKWTEPCRVNGGTGPTERAAHGAAAVDKCLYVTGGDAGHGLYHNDVHCFDTETRSWRRVETTGQAPTPRGWFNLCSVNKRLYMLFGTNGEEMYNDVFVFDTETRVWRRAAVAKDAPQPAPRHSPSSCALGHLIYCFGGVSERNKVQSDLWVFDTTREEWSPVTPAPGSAAPQPSYGHSAHAIGDKMIVFGGCRNRVHHSTTDSNETLEFRFSSRQALRTIPSSLAPDMLSLVDNASVFGDVAFVVEGKRVYAHKCVLAARGCQRLFESAQSSEAPRVPGAAAAAAASSGPSTAMLEVPLSGTHLGIVSLLEFLYTGSVRALETSPSTGGQQGSPDTMLAFELLRHGHTLGLEELERLCSQFLLHYISPETAAQTWLVSDRLGLASLREACIIYIKTSEIQLPTSLPSSEWTQADHDKLATQLSQCQLF